MINIRDKILAALATQDMTPADLADVIQCAYRSLYNGSVLMRLRSEEKIHVTGWIRAKAGLAKPIYRLGPGEDAERPEPLPGSRKTMDYRARNPEKVAKSAKRWKKANKERVNKLAKIARNRRNGIAIVEVIDPLLAAMMRPLKQQEEFAE